MQPFVRERGNLCPDLDPATWIAKELGLTSEFPVKRFVRSVGDSNIRHFWKVSAFFRIVNNDPRPIRSNY
jgi:hypothetical protein